MSFVDIAQFLYDIGFYDTILPFLFVFTIVFAILQKSLVFGTYPSGIPKKNINALVAFVIGFIFVASIARVSVFESITQRLALALVAMICIALLLGVFGSYLDMDFAKSKWYFLTIFMITVAIGLSAFGFSDFISGRKIADIVLTPFLVMAVVFLGVLYFIVRSGTSEKKSSSSSSLAKSGDAATSGSKDSGKSSKKDGAPTFKLKDEGPMDSIK